MENRKETDLNLSEFMDIVKYLEDEGDNETAERVLKDALDKCQDPLVRWTILISLSGLYYSDGMYAEMNRVSDLLIGEFPDNYAGYHTRIIYETESGDPLKAEEYMDSLPEDFTSHPQYLRDYLKVRMTLGETDYCQPLLSILSFEYGDQDATVSLMALHFLKGENAESAVLAKNILDGEEDQRTYRSFLAYIFQINNLYILSDKHPRGKAREWMKDALEWVKEYLRNTEIEENEGVNTLIRKMEQMVSDEDPGTEK